MLQDCISIPHTLQNCYQLLEKMEVFLLPLTSEDEVTSQTYELLKALLKDVKSKQCLLKVALSEA